jgi:phosphate:Na+ symporter
MTISAGQMTIELLGGLALFLFGIDQLTDSLKAVAGDRMKTILARLTSTRISGALTGAFVTAVIQSSSVTTVLVVGFTTAGLMSFSQSIGVIMGANIGTTITDPVLCQTRRAPSLRRHHHGPRPRIFRHDPDERCHGAIT